MRRGNVQHARRRRHPPGILAPIAIIAVCYPLLIWLLIELAAAVIA